MQTTVKTIKVRLWLPFSICLMTSPTVLSATQWQSCKIEQVPPTIITLPKEYKNGDTYFEADKALFSDVGVSTLSGNVIVVKEGDQFFADNISYDRETEIVKAKGHVRAKSGALAVKSREATFNLKTKNNTATDASYQILEANGTLNAQGKSKAVNQYGKDVSYLNSATYSACPVERPSWYLTASKIKLNHKTEVGTAHNVTLRVSKKDIPVFYFPYFNFPLTDERKSGFLFPSYSSSGRLGFGLSVPYYFNLAPNYDYTLTPTFLSKRGVKLDNEFRYLTDNDNGILHYDALFNDSKRNGENRYYYDIRHFTKLGEKTTFSINAEGISDSDYFDDFSDSLVSSSRAALERNIQIKTYRENWSLEGSLQDYQLLDGGSNPYRRSPQIVFDYDPPNSSSSGVDFSVTSELVHFDKRRKDSAPTGVRFDVDANLGKRFSSLAYFVQPSLKLRYTQYSLDTTNDPSIDKTQTRLVPSASIDGGLFFERSFADGKKIQTLEPRLYYTFTPFVDQSDIPLFDTSENSFRYNQSFTNNRFSGKDRVGDANRLTAALTSRILDQDTGDQLFTASVGQIFYFDDRKVTLPNRAAKTEKRSEIAVEFSGKVSENIKISSTSLWETDAQNIISGQLGLSYNDKKNRSISSEYRYRDGSLEQLDLSFSTPVKNNWRLFGGWNHDLQNSRILENELGIEYANCCIKSKLVARKFLTSGNDTYDNAILMEFSFKGLGTFSPTR